jgi:transposase, IS5 family
MRTKMDPQDPLDFSPARLKVTREYHQKYLEVDRILAGCSKILDVFHREVSRVLSRKGRKRRAHFTSDQLLRAILVMELEGLPYRDTVVRIDDSHFLRRFVRVFDGEVMDYTLLCKAYKAVSPEAWREINRLLCSLAIERQLITGTCLRVDTTACETNIHYPTDSSLLWDCYRVTSRIIARIREYDSAAVGTGRLQDRRVKRLMLKIMRVSSNTEANRKKRMTSYQELLAHVSRILHWSRRVRIRVREGLEEQAYDLQVGLILTGLLAELDHYDGLTERVINQTSRRVLDGESVPNSEKVFSIFEPHTELLIRGKIAKPIEFGHMVALHQVGEKFITGYDVFERRPTDESLVDGILEHHERTFGHLPLAFTADKGFYRSMPMLKQLEKTIPNVSIAKKGFRTEQETAREHHPVFRALQRFRAGIEGTISALKRVFKMSRCLYRSFKTYCSSIGAHVFAHNLIVLTRL